MKKISIILFTFILAGILLFLAGVSYILSIFSAFIPVDYLPLPVIFVIAALFCLFIGTLNISNRH